MKKLLLILFLLVLVVPSLHSQRIIFQSDFENVTLNTDSLPNRWIRIDEDGLNPNVKWAVRDTSCNFGGPTRPQAFNSSKSLEIPWYAGNGGNFINDDYVFTDSFTVRTGDSLIFWMLIGGTATFNNTLIDSMQVGYSRIQGSALWTKFATVRSLDSNNVWTEYKFPITAPPNIRIYIGWRYFMNVQVDGLWVNVDNVFIGNRSAIGIQPIGTNVPKTFALKQNYPNPFNPVTNIEFDLPKEEFVSLKVFNALGQEVKTLVAENLNAGSYKVDFDAKNLPSGAYFYRIEAGTFVKTSKMILTK